MKSSKSGAWTRALAAVGAGATVLYGTRVLLDFFGPALPYSMPDGVGFEPSSEDFLRFLSLVTDGTVRRSQIERLKNGQAFYDSELEAIRAAEQAINLEFYELQPGVVADRILAALTQRARAGVEVRVIVDAIGSFRTPDRYFDPLRAAGGQMRWYHPVRWNTWPKLNNRTHRKLMVIDGRTGFIGGAGIADHWLFTEGGKPAWRDTVLRVEGEGVAGLISAFSENWLESSGEILSGEKQFGFEATNEGARSFVVLSTPHGGGTQARILFQALLRAAQKSIRITTPYFLPDRSARRAMEAAVRRGVSVEILTAGPHIDHPVVRRLSRNSSGRLLSAGAKIYEYQPAMIHAKLMTVDGLWTVAGSTNFDHRSFALNDEVNIAVQDRDLAAVIEADFEGDLAQSRPLSPSALENQTWFRSEEQLLDDVLDWES